MKIRIKENSVRYRLSPTEVKKFCEEGRLESATQFKTATFTYVLKQEQIDSLQIDFNDNAITLQVPQAFAKDWYKNDLVGLEHYVDLADGTKFFLLLEKDFACLDNTHEDQTDKYPNPKAGLC